MKLSDRLYNLAEPLWVEAADKDFLINMAMGTLDKSLFKNYMIQDYLYLLDYEDILKKCLWLSGDEQLGDFLKKTIYDTEREINTVHKANMKEIGVSDEDIENCVKEPVIIEYIEYINEQLEKNGLLFGMTALLECSWSYAYIGSVMVKKYYKEITDSIYASWFKAYTDEEYIESNNTWIKMIDKAAGCVGEEEAVKLCKVFKTCAVYENLFWDALDRKKCIDF